MKEYSANNWLALTKEGEYITIDQVTDIHTDYYCPDCGEILHGKALNSEFVERHFWHLQNNNLNSCNCVTAYKRYWKDKFISIGEIITIPFLNNITCIAKEIDYKVNNDLIADIYIKSSNDDNILILFEDNKTVENSDLNYTIYYLNFMELKRDLTNINECLILLHSEEINKLNNEFKNKINIMINEFKNNLHKEEGNLGIDINKFTTLEEELITLKYYGEYELMSGIIKSLKNRIIPKYTYKNVNIINSEVDALRKLIGTLSYVTKFNIDLDLKLLKSINYKIYNKGYYSNSWNRHIYFDFIKPLGQEFNTYISKIEKVFNK